MALPQFGTSGWRAVIAEEFTVKGFYALVHSLIGHVRDHPEVGFKSPDFRRMASESKHALKVPRVVVGYDTRFLSDTLAREAAEIFAGAHVEVLLSDKDVPTPVVAHTVLQESAVGALNLTASHNPYYYNGVKWTPFWGGPATPEITYDLESRIHGQSHNNIKTMPLEKAKADGWVEVRDFLPSYYKKLETLVDTRLLKKSKLKVAVDAMHGAGRHYLRPFLEKHGVTVVGLHEDRDVLFGGQPPTPTEAATQSLAKLVKSKKLHMGFALDGDADRFGVVDSTGAWISPNEVLGLIVDHLVRNRKMNGKVARSLMTSHFVDAVAKSYGLTVRETAVGFKYIGDLLRTGEYLLGGEESGGLSIQNHVPEKDGILACLLLAELVSCDKKPLSKIRDGLFKKHGAFLNHRESFELGPGRNVLEIETRLKTKPPLELAGHSVWRIDDTDGYKFFLRDGSWLGLRPSGTEPLFRVYVEAHDKVKLKKLLDSARKLLNGQI